MFPTKENAQKDSHTIRLCFMPLHNKREGITLTRLTHTKTQWRLLRVRTQVGG